MDPDRFRPHPPKTRRAVEAMLRETDLSMVAIAARTGVPHTTVRYWNGRGRLRAWTRAGGPDTNPRNWPPERLKAANRLFARSDIDAGDLAEAMGGRRCEGSAMVLACALAAGRYEPDGVPDRPTLERALRAHVAGQITAFDARLREGGEGIDSARVLRDLGGLKRLLDDLARGRGPRRSRGGDRDGDADGESSRESPETPSRDLANLRAEIARRCEALMGEGPDRAASGGPARGPARSVGR